MRNEATKKSLHLQVCDLSNLQALLLKVCTGPMAMALVAGLIVEGWEGGLGFNPGCWRSCWLRMG